MTQTFSSDIKKLAVKLNHTKVIMGWRCSNFDLNMFSHFGTLCNMVVVFHAANGFHKLVTSLRPKLLLESKGDQGIFATYLIYELLVEYKERDGDCK
jgi:hypothetical protein